MVKKSNSRNRETSWIVDFDDGSQETILVMDGMIRTGETLCMIACRQQQDGKLRAGKITLVRKAP